MTLQVLIKPQQERRRDYMPRSLHTESKLFPEMISAELRPELCRYLLRASRGRREAAIMAQFTHPNVLTLHGVVSKGDPVRSLPQMTIYHIQNGE